MELGRPHAGSAGKNFRECKISHRIQRVYCARALLFGISYHYIVGRVCAVTFTTPRCFCVQEGMRWTQYQDVRVEMMRCWSLR